MLYGIGLPMSAITGASQLCETITQLHTGMGEGSIHKNKKNIYLHYMSLQKALHPIGQ